MLGEFTISFYVAPEQYMAVSLLAIGCYLVIPTPGLSEAAGESVYLYKATHLNERKCCRTGGPFLRLFSQACRMTVLGACV